MNARESVAFVLDNGLGIECDVAARDAEFAHGVNVRLTVRAFIPAEKFPAPLHARQLDPSHPQEDTRP